MNHRILLVTSEIPAQMGYPTAGGGLRAWNVAEGLRQQGFEVDYALMEAVVEGRSLPEQHTKYLWNTQNITEKIFEASPDIVVFCQWDPMSYVEKFPCPVVVDLFGLLLLENWFRQSGQIQIQAQAKLRTLAKADAFLVTSPTLRAYFTAWLTMAGCVPEDFPLLDVPISLPDEQPPLVDRSDAGELNFVYSGIFWPWQNPLLPLRTLAEMLEDEGKGKLVIYGGRHPVFELPEEAAKAAFGFLEDMKQCSRVEIRGLVPHEELMASFASMDVAVDVMQRNIERELSSPIRSACYLWAGLPPVVSDYLYLAQDLEANEAGWAVDPEDRDAMRKLFRWMVQNPDEVRSRRAKVREFAKRRHIWSVAIKPLAEFCKEPRYRKKERHLLDTTVDWLHEKQKEINKAWKEVENLHREKERLNELYHRERNDWLHDKDNLERRLHSAEHDLNAIRGKLMFRIFKRIQDIFAPQRKSE